MSAVTVQMKKPAPPLSGKSRSSTEAPKLETLQQPEPPRIAISDLLAGCRECIIVHDGSDYRLRITANGKLILTK